MSALIRDRYGVEVEAADETAVMVLDEAVHTLVGLEGDPVAAISAAADSGLVLARCLLAYLHCYSGSRRGYALARDVLDGTPDPSAPRERAHLAAARSWASGDLETATGHLERALLRHRRDLLALKIASDLYLALGDQVNLRDVAARVLPAWPEGRPGAGYRARDVRLRPAGMRRLPGGRALRPGRPRGRCAGRLGGARRPARLRDGGTAGRWAGVRGGNRAGLGSELLRGAQLVALGAVPAGTWAAPARPGRLRRLCSGARPSHPARPGRRGLPAVAALAARRRHRRAGRTRWPTPSREACPTPRTASTTGTR